MFPGTTLPPHVGHLAKLLYDRKAAAYVLSLSIRSIDYLIANKRLNTVRVGSKVMIGHTELVKFSRKNHPTVLAAEVSA